MHALQKELCVCQLPTQSVQLTCWMDVVVFSLRSGKFSFKTPKGETICYLMAGHAKGLSAARKEAQAQVLPAFSFNRPSLSR